MALSPTCRGLVPDKSSSRVGDVRRCFAPRLLVEPDDFVSEAGRPLKGDLPLSDRRLRDELRDRRFWLEERDLPFGLAERDLLLGVEERDLRLGVEERELFLGLEDGDLLFGLDERFGGVDDRDRTGELMEFGGDAFADCLEASAVPVFLGKSCFTGAAFGAAAAAAAFTAGAAAPETDMSELTSSTLSSIGARWIGVAAFGAGGAAADTAAFGLAGAVVLGGELGGLMESSSDTTAGCFAFAGIGF